jgi:hypothetical protein
MELWQGDLPDFISAASGPRLAADMSAAFTRIYRRRPAESEYVSWEQSLAAMAAVADEATTDDIGVLVEYHLPLSERRIDVMFFGRRAEGAAGTLLVELKRWESVSLEDEWALNVLTGDAEHVHPSQQALDYAGYLADTHSAYVAQEINVRPCAFCHEMSPAAGRPLRDPRFADLLARSPVFLAGEHEPLAELLNGEVGGGSGVSLMHKVRSGSFRPSKGIVQSLDAVLRHDDEWHLLDEQRLAFNAIWAEVQRLKDRRERSAVLVRGGPGTGKSVIAVQLLVEALRAGLTAVHSTGGKAFTTVMRGTFTGAQPLFIWNRTLRHARPMELDLLLTDEAHRIRETSDNRWTKKTERNRRSQVDELLDAAKVSVFFLDEHQYMRPDEIGDTRLVKEATDRRSIALREYDLSAQFRCGGSREYVEFVDYLLGFRGEPPRNWKGHYSFEVAADPDDLETVLDLNPDGSARLVAGFCWKWSEPRDDGSLVDDVVIGDWRRPWNRKEAKNKTYKPENHPYTLWATTAEGLGQVGCIYSAQGFEFDRVGVIWGPDLVWRDGRWLGQRRIANKTVSYDPGLRGTTGDQLTQLVRHAYRVLLTRGVRGTRVLCLDAETNQHLVRCIAASAAVRQVAVQS